MSILAERGMTDALTHFAVEMIARVLDEVAAEGNEFTAETVYDSLPNMTREQLDLYPNVLGAVFRAAAKRGEIRDTGKRVRSDKRDARGREVRVWVRR